MYKKMFAALALALALVTWAEAKKPAPVSSPSVEKKDVGPTVPSAIVEKKVAKLNEQIHWLSSLDEARELAQKQNKPILWLHALGDLDGIC